MAFYLTKVQKPEINSQVSVIYIFSNNSNLYSLQDSVFLYIRFPDSHDLYITDTSYHL